MKKNALTFLSVALVVFYANYGVKSVDRIFEQLSIANVAKRCRDRTRSDMSRFDDIILECDWIPIMHYASLGLITVMLVLAAAAFWKMQVARPDSPSHKSGLSDAGFQDANYDVLPQAGNGSAIAAVAQAPPAAHLPQHEVHFRPPAHSALGEGGESVSGGGADASASQRKARWALALAILLFPPLGFITLRDDFAPPAKVLGTGFATVTMLHWGFLDPMLLQVFQIIGKAALLST
jgi:hypothetical protein